jgi:periplasmic protein TonB
MTTLGHLYGWRAALGAAVAVLLASCASSPPPPAPAPVVDVAPPAPAVTRAPEPEPEIISHAVNPRDYRQDGARHIYSKNSHRIFKGRMPPLLQGVGTMQLHIGRRGEVVAMSWMRPPSHPGAKAEIERTIMAAAPYPAPIRLGGVVYTDTWLWDKSGRFQLDTLTEGQRSR